VRFGQFVFLQINYDVIKL